MPNKQQWSLFEWEYLDERGTAKPTTNWNFKDVNSERGTEMFIKYLGFSKGDFLTQSLLELYNEQFKSQQTKTQLFLIPLQVLELQHKLY